MQPQKEFKTVDPLAIYFSFSWLAFFKVFCPAKS